MAVNEAIVHAPLATVWGVLEDPYAYPKWVVGTDRTVEADADWPEPGSKFKVHIALGYSDFTHSEQVQPEKRIVLNAAGGMLGAARIEIDLHEVADGTKIRLTETPAGILAPLKALPPMHWAIKLRNVESLRRFKRLAESRR